MKSRPLAVYVTPSLWPWMDRLGMDVVSLHPGPGIFDLRAALDERGIVPDVILQDEVLAPRVLLKGLESFDCPKIFWAMDPHLNSWWQAPYAGLFDAVATTQKNWGRHPGIGPTRWLTWCAQAAPWTPWEKRVHPLAFVGRITEFRPMRRLFADFLASRFPLRLETDIPHDRVQGVYARSRLAPGESIGGEITQRLFLAAGAGCLVLEPLRDNGLEELFEPGREVDTYENALELAERAAWYLSHPDEALRMARAGHERCLRDHQPGNRLEALSELAREAATTASARGSEADRLFWLAAARCHQSSLLTAQPEDIARGLASHDRDPDCLVALLCLLAAGGEWRSALELGARRLAQGFAPGHAGLAACLCALALKTGEAGLAFTFHASFARETGDPLPRARTPAALYAALGESLARRGLVWRPGFPFDPDVHLPATAMEMLTAALCLEPDNQQLLRRCEALLRGLPGTELTRLGYLSELSLRNRSDFRLGLSLGLANLQAFRMEQGLEELHLARLQALEQGRSAAFERALAGRDRRGVIRSELERFVSNSG